MFFVLLPVLPARAGRQPGIEETGRALLPVPYLSTELAGAVLGGIGFTWEHEAHRYLKRAKTTQLLHGTPAEQRRLVSQRAGLR